MSACRSADVPPYRSGQRRSAGSCKVAVAIPLTGSLLFDDLVEVPLVISLGRFQERQQVEGGFRGQIAIGKARDNAVLLLDMNPSLPDVATGHCYQGLAIHALCSCRAEQLIYINCSSA
jgi:hypothetical protein